MSEKDLAEAMAKRAAYEATLPRERTSGGITRFTRSAGSPNAKTQAGIAKS